MGMCYNNFNQYGVYTTNIQEEDPFIYMDPIFDDELPELIHPDEDGYSPMIESVPLIDEYTQYDDLREFLTGIDFLNSNEPEDETIDEDIYDYQYEPIQYTQRMSFFEPYSQSG